MSAGSILGKRGRGDASPAAETESRGESLFDDNSPEMYVFLNLDEAVLQKLKAKLPPEHAGNEEALAEWFAGLRVPDVDDEAQRALASDEQNAFFERVIDGKFGVTGFSEFRYSRDNTIEREYWIWDFKRPDEYVVMHIHYAGAWSDNPEERAKSREIVTSVNIRHSVSADGATAKTWYDKCDDMNACRENKGTKVQHLPPRWTWQSDPHTSVSGFAVQRIMLKGEKCTVQVRALIRSAEGASSIPSIPSSSGNTRHALILAAGDYKHLNRLPNAVRDGEVLKSSLEKLKWVVELVKNPTRDQAREKLQSFYNQCEKVHDAIMIAFIGHGCQTSNGGYEYFFPTDARLENSCLVETQCVNTLEVRDKLKWSRFFCSYPPSLFLFDCCRTDALRLPASRESASETKSVRNGHPRDEPPTSPYFLNLFEIFSTNAGNTASDGESGKNGPFMELFQRKIFAPGVSVLDMLTDIAYDLVHKYGQRATFKSNAIDKFYFVEEEKRPLESGLQAKETSSGPSKRTKRSEENVKAVMDVIHQFGRAEGSGGDGIAKVVEGMKRFQSDEDVQENGCNTLRILCEKNKAINRNWLITAGGVETIISGMEACSTISSVQLSAMKVLESLYPIKGGKTQNKINARIIKAKGTQAIIGAMKSNLNVEELQSKGCNVLKNIATNERNLRAILKAGGIEAVVTAMEGHTNNKDMSCTACEALMHFDSYEVAGDVIREKGKIRAIVRAMKIHADDSAVQQYGCGALQFLAMREANRVVIHEKEGIETIVCAMKRHEGMSKVQEYGCGALLYLALHQASRVVIHEKDGIEAIVCAMKSIYCLGCAPLQANGCGALRNLAWNEENRVVIREKEGIEAILCAMRSYKRNTGVQRRGCGALWDLALNEENSVVIREKEGIEAIVCAMRSHEGVSGVQEECCGALRTLALKDENRVVIRDKEGIEAIVCAMRSHEGVRAVQERGCGALWHLALNEENRVVICEKEGIEAIVCAMKTFKDKSAVQLAGCSTLLYLAMHSVNSVRIDESGGIEVIVCAMKTHQGMSGVQEAGCRALHQLARSLKKSIRKQGGIEVIEYALQTHKSDNGVQEHGRKALESLKRLPSTRKKG